MKRVFLFLIIPFAAQAGIRGVGLGGGHGEMQAFLADRKLPQILAGIRGCENALSADSRPLRPDPTCHSEREPGTVYLSSCALYEFGEDGEISGTKAFSEIAAIVLAARTGRPIDEARKILGGLAVKEKSLAVLPGDAEIKLRLLEVSHARGQFTSFMIESPRTTLDLNDNLQSALSCGSEASWSLRNLRVFASASPDHALTGDLAWTCGTKLERAELRIFIRYDGKDLRPENVRFLLIR